MELLGSAGTVRCRRMFGGWGFYVDELFVALLAEDQLYLKVGEQTRAQFVAAAGKPFVYGDAQQPVALGFYTPPADALDSPARMRPWALLALQAARTAMALRARKTKNNSL